MPQKRRFAGVNLIISFSVHTAPPSHGVAIKEDQIDAEIDTNDEVPHADLEAGPIASIPPKTEQPETPQSAPPSLKRPKILRKPASTSTPTPPPVPKSEPDFRGTDLFALKRELFLEEHEAKMVALAEEKALKTEAIAEEMRLKSELFQWEIRAAKSKDEYYRAKLESMRQIRNMPAFADGIPRPGGEQFPGYPGFPTLNHPPSGQPCGAIENSFSRPSAYPQLQPATQRSVAVARNQQGPSWIGQGVSGSDESLYSFQGDGVK